MKVSVMDGGVGRCQSVPTVLAGILHVNHALPLTVHVCQFGELLTEGDLRWGK